MYWYTSNENLLTVEDKDLRNIECGFNEKMKLMICRHCDLAIPAEHIAVHARGKHGIRCSAELAESIISKFQPLALDTIIEFKNTTEELDSPVEGIPIKRGYRCLICRHCAYVWGSMTDHFIKQHRGQDVREQIEKDVEMQLLFGGQLKKWFSIREPGAALVDEQNEDAWTAAQNILAEDKRRVAKGLMEKEENVRLINGFITQTRWDVLVDGEDCKKLMGMAAVAKEKEHLQGIMELCQMYFERISDKLRIGDVLLRRKIMSEGYVTCLDDC